MASKKKSPEFLAHREMMAQWEREGRVSNQELSIKRLTLDQDFQARVETLDAGHVSKLEVTLIEGRQLEPIVVFEVGKQLIVGDGFHRTDAHVRNGKRSINAKVVENATRQEAIEYATCCNIANLGKPMAGDDKKKACWMLLENGWLARTADELSRHTGASPRSIIVWRAEWCEREGKSPPNVVVRSDGRTSRTVAVRNSGSVLLRRGRARFRLGGKTVVPPAKTEQEAILVATDLRAKRKSSLALLANQNVIAGYLARRDIWLNYEDTARGLSGGACRGFAVTFIPEDLRSHGIAMSTKLLIESVGRAVLIAEHHGLARKVVLVFESIETHEAIVSLARRLGIEFMTLDQFVETVKADEGESDKAKAV